MPFWMLLILSVFAGAGAGYLANLAADKLPGWGTQVEGERAEGTAPNVRVPWRSRAVMAALAVLFPLLAFQQGGAIRPLLVSWCYAWFLVTVLVIDLETRRVLNVMVGPAAVFAVAAGLWLGEPSLPSILGGGLAAFLLFFGLFLLGRVMYGRGALGFGDVKLAGVIGLMTGYPGVLPALTAGALLGAAAAIFLIVTRRASLRATTAYAPYLAIGAMLALWAGLGGS